MSVVKVKDRTTTSEEKFKNNVQSINSFIYLEKEDYKVEEFSLEVHLGEGWNDQYSPTDTGLIKIDDEITLQGHSSIVVEVSEEIRVPYNRYGIILPTGSMFLSKGLLIPAAKVEPAFVGKLKVRMYNTTSKPAKIKKGDKIGSVVFFTTETTSPLKEIYKKSDISAQVITRTERITRWISLNTSQFITWIIAGSALILTALNIAFTHSDKIFTTKPIEPTKQTTAEPQKQNNTTQSVAPAR